VFCDVAAAPVIKSYSPDLIVHPFSNCGKYAMAEFKYLTSGDQLYIHWLSRLHALLVGPGMGRDHFMMETVMKFVKHAMDAKLPLIFDADGLHMLQKFPKLLEGYSNVVLTPNIAEFRSLCESRQIHSDTETAINELSATFNNAIIVLKGATDIIAQGNHGNM
jgi:ATP-dependent NAD(P)H-hydrate dehydratase